MNVMRYVRQLANTRYRAKSVAVLHSGRCGSTVLGDMMRQTTSVHWAGELFEPIWKAGNAPYTGPRLATDVIERSRAERVSRVFGFSTKFLPYQHLNADCIDMELKAYLDLLTELGMDSFIVMHRRNHLRKVTSEYVGRKTNQWHNRTAPGAPTRIVLDPASVVPRVDPAISLLDLFKLMDAQLNEALRVLERQPALVLTYEDDVQSDPFVGYRKICSFLEMAPGSPSVRLDKTNPFAVRDIVENFDDVARVLSDTKYAWMLRD